MPHQKSGEQWRVYRLVLPSRLLNKILQAVWQSNASNQPDVGVVHSQSKRGGSEHNFRFPFSPGREITPVRVGVLLATICRMGNPAALKYLCNQRHCNQRQEFKRWYVHNGVLFGAAIGETQGDYRGQVLWADVCLGLVADVGMIAHLPDNGSPRWREVGQHISQDPLRSRCCH